ncbi:hypothetical protein BZA05DRAFT_239646 [Tricharina praecox]|uniref:uncharacterized protein n=1 Tax=Tricharina praecox TaxID=43433 RepID=UPI00221E40D8|nr:uncharacterized protein BZA05DRAFT_239646 [Tricharina praecox]KAI5855426.1 hypothetical protein BZA05DRAFT_239646 [Tricharina praecox]
MKSSSTKLFPMLDTSPKGLGWPSVSGFNRIRRKFGSRMRSGQSPASNLAKLQTSFDPNDTIRSLRAHTWSIYDGQYLILMILGIFCLSVIEEPGALVKTSIATLLMLSLLLPITRQFFLPFLPIASWLVLFYSCSFIPAEWRPHIWVRVLPALENIIYGANLSNILSAHKHPILDVLAWLPYGIFHFAFPFVCAGVMFLFAAPGTLRVYARTFGYMNLIGVIIQLCFPCAPPWYEAKFGMAPANYSMGGSPAGLARIDALFGWNLYSSTFTASPLVFGAMPSLHSGCATLEALFLAHVFPKARWVFYSYVMWIWWATLYLQHHYAVDLIAGSLLAGLSFYVAKTKFLARLQPDKEFRWDYDYLEIGSGSSSERFDYGLYDLDSYHSEDDEWTVGSSSGISSGCRSPVSPSDDIQSVWSSASETLAATSEVDSSEVYIPVDDRR